MEPFSVGKIQANSPQELAEICATLVKEGITFTAKQYNEVWTIYLQGC